MDTFDGFLAGEILADGGDNWRQMESELEIERQK